MGYKESVTVDTHQFHLAIPTADTLAVTQYGGLIETGSGFVTVMTGIAHGQIPLTIDLLDTEPGEDEVSAWEVVEETSISAKKPLHVMRLDGELEPGFEPIPPGKYRLRAYAKGRDADYDIDVSETAATSEQHLIQLWPTDNARSRKIRQLRKTDEAYNPVENPWEKIDNTRVSVFGPDGSIRWVPFEGPEHLAVRQRMHDFLADPASSSLKVAEERIHASYLAVIDPGMIALIVGLPQDRQREFSLWCVVRSFERADLADLPWVREGLEALKNGTQLPHIWQQPHLVQYEIHKDRAGQQSVSQDSAILFRPIEPQVLTTPTCGISRRPRLCNVSTLRQIPTAWTTSSCRPLPVANSSASTPRRRNS